MIYHLHLPFTTGEKFLKMERFISAIRSGKSVKCHLYVDDCSNRSSPQQSHCSVSATIYTVLPLTYFLQLMQAKTSANVASLK